jgi:hypothetical protein
MEGKAAEGIGTDALCDQRKVTAAKRKFAEQEK